VSASLDQLIPELQPFARDLVSAAGSAGLQPRVTSTRRSHSEQTRLYRRYLQGLQQFPVAPPGTSSHEYGYSFDMVVSPMEALSDVGAYWEQLGGVWGGEFNDPIHFEYPGFVKPAEKSLAYKLETGAASLFVPPKIASGLTVAQWLHDHPWIDSSLLFGLVPGFETLLGFTVDALPQWIKDVLEY